MKQVQTESGTIILLLFVLFVLSFVMIYGEYRGDVHLPAPLVQKFKDMLDGLWLFQ